MMKKSILCYLLSMALCISLLAGCATSTEQTSEEITLVEPVGVTENYAYAEKRDLINYEVYSGKVVPVTKEFSFASSQQFETYGALPGTAVKAGDAVAIASTETIDEQIKAKKEQIANAEINYEEEMEEVHEKLSAEKGDVDWLKQVVSNFENMNEEERKNYKNYESEYRKYLGYYQSTVANIERYEQQIKAQTDSLNLDVDYFNKEIKRLNQKRNDVLATAPIDGTVVAVNYFENGNWVNKETIVGAIGDFSQLRVKTEFVYKNDVKRAVEYFAYCNGKRYEAIYMEEESAVGSSPAESYSSFSLVDPNGEINVGDFVVIVLIKNIKNDALCVPNEAVNSDTDGSYVYLYSENGTSRMTVSTGIKSGFFTEITAGLSEGDKIVSEFKVDKATKTEKLSKGKINAGYNETGYLFYSKIERIANPVEYGTTYINSLEVKQYERVSKGQVIANIKVVADDINIRRKERTLLRANEDLNSLIADGEEANKRSIKHQREYIEDLTKEINEMKADGARTQIVAPFDGIITSVGQYEEGDLLLAGSNICTIADEANCFITVEDQKGLLTYGNKTVIEYDDENGKKATAEGTVVTVAPCGLSGNLKTGFSLIRVSSEDLAKMASSNRGFDGWWMRSHFSVKAELRTVDNVVLVPKRAVKTENGITYVIVMDENNKPTYKSFIAGGSDSSNYWVVDGLDEGTVICLE